MTDWSDPEVARLKSLHGRGLPTRDIARSFPERSQASVQFKLNSLGLFAHSATRDLSAIKADEAVLQACVARGLDDREIRTAHLPHRSVSWIEKHRCGAGLQRARYVSRIPIENAEETDAEIAARIRRSSDRLLAALQANHPAGTAERRLKSGTPRILPRGTAAFSVFTSFGALCAEIGHAD